VEELQEKQKLTMDEYVRKYAFPDDVFAQHWQQKKNQRRFVITCQVCGFQKEFREIPKPAPWEEEVAEWERDVEENHG